MRAMIQRTRGRHAPPPIIPALTEWGLAYVAAGAYLAVCGLWLYARVTGRL